MPWKSPHNRRLPPLDGPTLIMGVLNLTPDSFSDGGLFTGEKEALQRVETMIAEGAHVIDIGGESTRPGATQISVTEERCRVIPVIRAIRRAFPELPLSIDTFKAEVAREAIDAGVDIVNDIWGAKYGLDIADLKAWETAIEDVQSTAGLPPSPMATVVAEKQCPYIAMHNREKPEYDDFWTDLLFDLRVSLALLQGAGVPKSQIWLDPGFGFGKTVPHNLEVIKNLHRLNKLGHPLLVGTSRKSTLGKVLNRPVNQRLEGTAATAVWSIAEGCKMVRVHDVAEIVPFAMMADAVRAGLGYPSQ
jgi:dihydropteroate synthase